MSATNHDDTAGIPFPPPLAFISGLAVGAGLHHFIPAPILQAARGVNALKVVGAALLIFGFGFDDGDAAGDAVAFGWATQTDVNSNKMPAANSRCFLIIGFSSG